MAKLKLKRSTRPIKLLIILVLIIAFIILLVMGVKLAQKSVSVGAQATTVIVSEVMTGNKGAVSDALGNHPDYIELYNRGTEAVNISGYTLSDREYDAWLIPDETIIQPGKYLIVWCTGETVEEALVANFKLSMGEVLRFSDSGGNILLQLELPAVFSGYTYSYNLSTQAWEEMLPSPGYSNDTAGIAAYEQSKLYSNDGIGIQSQHNGVYISELMAKNSTLYAGPDGSFPDWIELYNSTGSAVNLAGCGISDDETKPYKYTFAEGVSIPAYGYLMLYCTTGSVDGYICLDFALSSSGETLLLTDAVGGILDIVSFGAQAKDHSFARVYSEAGAFDPQAAFADSETPTPGYPNTYAGWQAFEQVRYPDIGVHDVSLNEILTEGYTYYVDSNGRPQDRDLGAWIELYNRSDGDISLSGYGLSDRITGAVKWVFPEGTSIAAKGYLIVYLDDSLPLEGQTNDDVTAQQLSMTASFDIAGGGEGLYLYNNAGELIDRVNIPPCRAGISYGRTAGGDWALFETPTQGEANSGDNAASYCEIPALSVDSGLYHEAQSVTISVPEGCYVTYTTDCTEPKEDGTRYSGAISVTANTVLRARAFSSNGSRFSSDVASNTYLIVTGEESTEAHNISLPVVFLVTEPDNLWADEIGIYIKSSRYNESTELGANFNQSGREWERHTHFTYCSPGGTNVEYEGDLMMRIFGAFSRKKEQKGLALVARKGYGPTKLEYPFFSDRPFTEYKSLVLRASGQDAPSSRIRDVLVAGLANDYNLDISVQAYVQCVVYLNGKYWGVYNLREKTSKYFVAQHYSITDPDSISILVGNGSLTTGDTSAKEDYAALIKYCEDRNCDLSNPADYDYVRSKVDVENFAMYCALEIIVGNTDTGNIKFWRSTELDNKWRWLVYDFCYAMNRNDEKELAYTSGYRRDFYWRYFNPEGHGAGKGFSTVLGRSLLQNNDFVEIFLKYCAVMINEVYSKDKILAKVDELRLPIENEMAWDFPRWGLTLKNWTAHLNNIRGYAENYTDYSLKYCQDYINEHTNYRLTDEKMIELFGRTSSLD